MAILPLMRGVVITECNINDKNSYINSIELHSGGTWYRIEAGGAVSYVAAGAIVTNEDELGYEDPSPLLANYL